MFVEINPYSLANPCLKKKGVPGVYIWGYCETDRTFIPLYVGKTRNIFERLIQHYCRFKAGEYSVFDRQQLINHYCNNVRTIPKKVYEPISFENVMNFHRMSNNAYMVENFLFRYVAIEEELVRAETERYLSDIIGRDFLITFVAKGEIQVLSEPTKTVLFQMARTKPVPF